MTEDLKQLGTRLEAAVANAGIGDVEALPGPLGDLLNEINNLVLALKSRDLIAAARALRNLLNIALGEDSDKIEFQAALGRAGIDWNKVLEIIQIVLPIILSRGTAFATADGN